MTILSEIRQILTSICNIFTKTHLVGKKMNFMPENKEKENIMLGLFAKKEMSFQAAKSFWTWFAEKEEWIISTIKTNGMDVVWAVDAQLKPVFPYFKKELEFQVGFNAGKGEFFFFHLGNKSLMRDAGLFAGMMPQELAERWKFIIEE